VTEPQLSAASIGTTPSGAIFDRLNDSMTRPVPQVPSPMVPVPESTWVPDRYVPAPRAGGLLMVPGHWERPLSDHEVYTPPLTGRGPNGNSVEFLPGFDRRSCRPGCSPSPR
ncbi:MAG TPA: hypothetical protein VJS92_04385, partial [Candidatus Polarisedimenticolaceae bacterium]|nr:hypothetical protein [Candidatus Polarisedimenticolaceae bacterium]